MLSSRLGLEHGGTGNPVVRGAAKRLALSVASAALWFTLTAAFSYKAEGILFPLDRSGALPIELASKWIGALALLQILGGLAFPWIRLWSDRASGGPGLAGAASAALAGVSGSLIACGIFAAQYPAARELAALWALACLLAAAVTTAILPAERGAVT